MKHIVFYLTIALLFCVLLLWETPLAQAGGLLHHHHRGQAHIQNNIIVGGGGVVPGAAFAPVRSYGCCGGCCGGSAAIVQQSYVPVQTQRTIVQQS
jgi:hypothetical protein